MTIDKTTSRLDARSFDIALSSGEPENPLWVTISAVWDKTGALHEVVFVRRPGKIGQALDIAFNDASVALSRLAQRRDPETGEKLD